MTPQISRLISEASNIVARGQTSCSECNHNYCCVNQKDIEIAVKEWDNVVEHITEEQRERAIVQVKRMYDKKNIDKLFNCPFNNPETGLCEIYEYRFIVCAQYQVLNPKEHCNSDTRMGLSILNPMNIFGLIVNDKKYKDASEYIMDSVKDGSPINMIKAWENQLKKENRI